MTADGLFALILTYGLGSVAVSSNPEYPASTSDLEKNECNSAWKTPSATNFLFFEIFLAVVDIK
jgi:hypothetical protein